MQQFIINPVNLRGEWQVNWPLAKYTSWRIGGAAKYYYRPADIKDLENFLQQLPEDIPIFWLGLGSNVLIRDSGFPGIVIHAHKVLTEIAVIDPTEIRLIFKKNINKKNQFTHFLRIEAGVTCAKIAKFCIKHNLVGGEFFAGIPGTMGGALAMNAGAFASETWDFVFGVETIDRYGYMQKLATDRFKVSYRSVISTEMEQKWFIAGYLGFMLGDSRMLQERVNKLLKARNITQPIGELSCGSVFKNPPGNYAAKLIEACGLKGFKIGNAQVSLKHANFIINTHAASAADIEQLIKLIQDKVWLEHNIKLETEVKFIG